MNSDELRKSVRETVSSLTFAWSMLNPEMLRLVHQMAIDTTPALTGQNIRAAFDEPIHDLTAGTQIRPSEMRRRLVDEVIPLQLIAVQAIAEEAVSTVRNAPNIKRHIEAAAAAANIDREAASRLHHWRFVRNIMVHSGGVVTENTVREWTDDRADGIVTFDAFHLWGALIPTTENPVPITERQFEEPFAVTTPPVPIVAGTRLSLGLADVYAAGELWADFVRALGL